MARSGVQRFSTLRPTNYGWKHPPTRHRSDTRVDTKLVLARKVHVFCGHFRGSRTWRDGCDGALRTHSNLKESGMSARISLIASIAIAAFAVGCSKGPKVTTDKAAPSAAPPGSAASAPAKGLEAADN